MAHLIPLHRPSGSAVWVNPEAVALMESYPYVPDGAAQLRLTSGHVTNVRETPDEILALLGLPGERISAEEALERR